LAPHAESECLRFAEFELDLRTGELGRNGQKTILQDQPFQILAALLERPGQLITREELRRRLWSSDTFVDFDQGLNKGVNRLRDLLEDSAEHPRFIETLPRRGYRFIAAVERVNAQTPLAASNLPPRRSRWSVLAAGVAALLLTAGTIWFVKRPQPAVPALKQRQLTGNSSENPVKSAAVSPDGKYLAYADMKGIHLQLIPTGETQSIPQPEPFKGTYMDWDIKAWLADSTGFYATAFAPGQIRSIWQISVLGGAPRKLRDDAMAWSVSPDGLWLAFTRNLGRDGDREIWLMGTDGSHAHKLYEADGENDFERVQWSPDGHRLLYVKQLRAGDKIQESLESRDLQGGPANNILLTPPNWEKDGLRDFYWLQNGRLIYLLGDPSSHGLTCDYWEMKLDVRSGKAIGAPGRMTGSAGFCMDNTGVTKDGRRLVFTKFWEQHSVYVADLEAGGTRISIPRRLTLTDDQELPIGWAGDGRSLFFESNRNAQWGIFRELLDEDAPAQSIASVPGRSEIDNDMLRSIPRITPDGASVLYSVLPEKNSSSPAFQLMRAPTVGGVPQLTAAASVRDMPHCARIPSTLCVIPDRTPDSKQIHFVSFDPQLGVGRTLAQLDLGASDSYNWDLSPDGTRLAVISGSSGLIHIFSGLGERVQSRTIQVRDWGNFVHLVWAADGKGFFAVSVTPQGSVLLSVDLLGNAHLLWRQSGESDLMTYVVPSPDGRHLAISGFTNNSNVWMMEDF
jgi:DNA-binding winged helix-turn-helix (wHTH) protein/Tol biopolymer transport system component